jgi:hypothetical protein
MGVLVLVQCIGQFLGTALVELLLGPNLDHWFFVSMVVLVLCLLGTASSLACRIKEVVTRVMCYPCTMCNGCGKMDSELFASLRPIARCMNCGKEYIYGDTICSSCGLPLPLPPGFPVEDSREGAAA